MHNAQRVTVKNIMTSFISNRLAQQFHKSGPRQTEVSGMHKNPGGSFFMGGITRWVISLISIGLLG